MKRYIYTNSKGKSIQMGAFTPFLIERIEGVSEIKNQISTVKGMHQDGNSISNKTLDTRHIMIEGAIDAVSKDEIERLRRELIKVFNAKHNGVLTREYRESIRKIDCEIESVKFAPENQRSQKFMISLMCSNPYWNDIEESSIMSAFINLFKFPLTFPMQFGAEGSQVNINNIGDIETPVRIVMRGVAVNPKLINMTTGEFIKINKTLGKEDMLEINTEFGNKEVLINGKNVYGDMTMDSSLFELEQGINVLTYETDSGAKDAKIEIYYKNRYIGI